MPEDMARSSLHGRGGCLELWTEFLEDKKIVVGERRLREDGIFTLIFRKPMLHVPCCGPSLTLSWDRILVLY